MHNIQETQKLKKPQSTEEERMSLSLSALSIQHEHKGENYVTLQVR